MNRLNTSDLTENILHQIIDELHPRFKAHSDEEMIEKTETYGVFQRAFRYKTGRIFLFKWKVFFGTPETVKTVFEPVMAINPK